MSFDVHDEHTLAQVLQWVRTAPSGRGYPALEFARSDGSSLVLAIVDNDRAHLGWTDSLGESRSSAGGPPGEEILVFDYFGSWSEVPSERTLPMDRAIDALSRYLAGGVPESEDVTFTLD